MLSTFRAREVHRPLLGDSVFNVDLKLVLSGFVCLNLSQVAVMMCSSSEACEEFELFFAIRNIIIGTMMNNTESLFLSIYKV